MSARIRTALRENWFGLISGTLLAALVALMVVLTATYGNAPSRPGRQDARPVPAQTHDNQRASEQRVTKQSAPAKAKAPAKPVAKPAAKPKPTPVPKKIANLDEAQTANAVVIVDTARKLGVGERGAVIALATASQESTFYNRANDTIPESKSLPHQQSGTDYDSVGLFQQRPVAPWGQGHWGTIHELMNPKTATTKFVEALKEVPNWQSLPVTVAAQTVQVSAHPDFYADDEPLAWHIVQQVPRR